MKKVMAILLAVAMAVPSLAQRRHAGRQYGSEGVYLFVGGTFGPSFSDFVDYVNSVDYPVKRLENFGGNASLAMGYISRFHRNFGIDVGVSFYGLNSKGVFSDPNGTIPEAQLNRRLEYKAAIFTGTLPIYFEFGPPQPVVPYVGVGISIFSMTLDDYFGNYAWRDTRTAVGAHFQAGLGVKLTSRFWIDLRGRWHAGSGHLSTLEDNFRDFAINQNIAQYALGFDVFFR
jgi:opacity protein-like surface antigen